MFQKLLPKKHRFVQLFEQQIPAIKKGLDLFGLVLKEYSRQEKLIVSEVPGSDLLAVWCMKGETNEWCRSLNS